MKIKFFHIILFVAFLIISLGAKAQGPGGVTNNLEFWFKADQGVNTFFGYVTSWTDASGNGNNASAYSIFPLPPRYRSLHTNYNPANLFSASGDGLLLRGTNNVNQQSRSRKSFTIAFTTGNSTAGRQMIYEQGDRDNGINVAIVNGQLTSNLYRSSVDKSASIAIATNTDYVYTFIYDGSSNRWDGYLNGVLTMSQTSVASSLPAHPGDNIGLGESVDYTQYDGGIDVQDGDEFAGYIMEMAYYDNVALSTTDRNRIESHMALRYGITLGTNYLGTNGNSPFWSLSTNTGYNNDITGIGTANSSNLLQKQSGSQYSNKLISIGVGDIFSSNANNTSTINGNNKYLTWGNNGDVNSFSATGAPASRQILQRQWKVQRGGNIGTVKIQIADFTNGSIPRLPNTVPTLDLLVDSDGDFTGGASIIPMTLVNNFWEATTSFSNGDHFSFSYLPLSTSTAVVNQETNGNETGPQDIVYKLTLSSPNQSGATLTYPVSFVNSSTTTNGTDHSFINGASNFTVPVGDSVAYFNLTVVNDNFVEGTETLTILVGNSANPLHTVTVNQASATIIDNDFTPGGVNQAFAFWLRADDSTSTTTNGAGLSAWYDKSTNGLDATAGGTQPIFNQVASNYNPAVHFTATNSELSIPSSSLINLATSTAKSYSIAFKTGNDISTLQMIYEQGGTGRGISLYVENNELHSNMWSSSNDNHDASAILANTVYVCTFIYSGSGQYWHLYINGQLEASDLSMLSSFNSHSGAVGIGGVNGNSQFHGPRDRSGSYYFRGEIMEMIYFHNVVLTSTERSKLESYLALKYAANYKSSLNSSINTTVWDATANASFTNGIAGLASDGLSGFSQKQAYSSVSREILHISLNQFAIDNLSNANNFSGTHDFLVWGHNNGALNGVANNTLLPSQSGLTDQFDRVYRIEETGTIASTKLAFKKDSTDRIMEYSQYGNLYVRMATNAALTSGMVDYPLAVEVINGDSCYTLSHNFSGVNYFTIVQKDAIVWSGSEWRGGMSAATPHGPSDDALDQVKPMIILRGDTAEATEAIIVNHTYIDTTAVLSLLPNNCLTVNTITSHGRLHLAADSTGYGQYFGPPVSAMLEQYIDDYGWHLIGSPFSNATWDSLSFKDGNGFANHPLSGSSLDSCAYCNFWWYDAATDNGNDIGFALSDAYGTWRSSSNGNESFTPTKGWNMHFNEYNNFGSAPWTVQVTGTFNDGNISQQINENNAGWNLVANPYPSALDWDNVDNDLAAAGIANGYHVWDHENTNYAVYANGTGTYGLNRYIAPFQGFYVQTSTAGNQNSGDVFRNFDLQNSDRPATCPGVIGNTYKSSDVQQILVQTKNTRSGKIDQTIIRLSENSQRQFEPSSDTRKLFTEYKDVPSLYSKVASQFMVINTMPHPLTHDSVLLGTRTVNGHEVTIEALDAPAGYTVYLEDIKTGEWHRIDRKAYPFVQDNSIKDRFWLHFGPDDIETNPWTNGNPFTVFVKDDVLILQTQKIISNANWYISSSNGSLKQRGVITSGDSRQHEIGINKLAPGVYFFVLTANNTKYTSKILIL